MKIKEHTYIYAMLFMFLLDGITTKIGLRIGLVEVNPLPRYLHQYITPMMTALLGFIIILITIKLLSMISSKPKDTRIWSYKAVIFIQTLTQINNILSIVAAT